MAYGNDTDFKKHYEVASLAAKAIHGDIGQTKTVDPDVAWMAYSHARNPQLGFHVFGRHLASRDLQPFRTGRHITQDLPANLQGISLSPYDKFKENFGYINDVDDGSILMMGGDKWNFTVNDSWLLAGVHSYLPFYSASVIARGNIYDNEYFLTITGRELLGLACYGYQQVHGHDSLGVAYQCTNRAKADSGTLVDYQAVVGEIKSMQDAAAIFRNAGFTLV